MHKCPSPPQTARREVVFTEGGRREDSPGTAELQTLLLPPASLARRAADGPPGKTNKCLLRSERAHRALVTYAPLPHANRPGDRRHVWPGGPRGSHGSVYGKSCGSSSGGKSGCPPAGRLLVQIPGLRLAKCRGVPEQDAT